MLGCGYRNDRSLRRGETTIPSSGPGPRFEDFMVGERFTGAPRQISGTATKTATRAATGSVTATCTARADPTRPRIIAGLGDLGSWVFHQTNFPFRRRR